MIARVPPRIGWKGIRLVRAQSGHGTSVLRADEALTPHDAVMGRRFRSREIDFAPLWTSGMTRGRAAFSPLGRPLLACLLL
jgi:hypothetical protein